MTAIASTQAVHRPWFRFFSFLYRDREAELRTALNEHGVTILPTRLVDDHVAKMERLSRPTFWHSVLYIIAYVTSILSLRLPLHLMMRESSVMTGIIALLLAIGGGLAAFFGASSIFALPATVWALEITIFLFLVVTENKFKGKALETVVNAVSRWQFYRPSALLKDTLPAHIIDRLSVLEDIPGVRPRILADTNDPFLVAVSGYGPFTTRLYVGAWRTGNAKLDAFR